MCSYCVYMLSIFFAYQIYIVFVTYHDIILPEHPQTLDSGQLVKKHLGEIHPRCFTEHSTADSFLMNFLGNMIPKAFVVNVIPARCVLQMMRNKTTTKQKHSKKCIGIEGKPKFRA